MKRLIGLTGGIATGKSTVAKYLAQAYQFPILDADIYAREAVNYGSPLLAKIVERYGKDVLEANGDLNRGKLGEIVFKNKPERLWLESLIHPFVRERFFQEIRQSSQEILVLVIPLLFEAKITNLVTEIWVVSCSESQQLERLMSRNSLTLEQAQARINSQIPLAEKTALADVVLDNSKTWEILLEQIDLVLMNIQKSS
jgi:dephospho-CoA kinase